MRGKQKVTAYRRTRYHIPEAGRDAGHRLIPTIETPCRCCPLTHASWWNRKPLGDLQDESAYCIYSHFRLGVYVLCRPCITRSHVVWRKPRYMRTWVATCIPWPARRAVGPHIIVCCSGSVPGPGPAPLCRGRRSVQLSGRPPPPPPCLPLTHPTPLQSRGSKGLPGTSCQGLNISRDKDICTHRGTTGVRLHTQQTRTRGGGGGESVEEGDGGVDRQSY